MFENVVGLNYRVLFLDKKLWKHDMLFFLRITTKRNPVQSEFHVLCLFCLMCILESSNQ